MFQDSLTFKLILACLLCVNAGAYAQTPPSLPAPYGSNIATNAVRVWTAKIPLTNQSDMISGSRTNREVEQVTQYTDGFGRPLQVVTKQGSPLGKDMVTANVYNTLGQEQYKYLPFASNVATAGDVTNDGNFKTDPFQQQTAFYNTQLSGQTGETNVGANNLNWAFTQSSFDNSPLNRAVNTYAPGANWVGQSHSAQVLNLANTATDNVQIWNIAAAQGSLPANGGVYAAGVLYKTITKDENGIQLIQFKDRDGHLILVKEQLTASTDVGTGSDHPGWLCTYYVYDDVGNQRFIITPKVVNLIYGTTWGAVTQALADDLCYRYEYDQAGNVIIKRNPGTGSGTTGEIWMVYDQRYRLVMQQDGQMRASNLWKYFQYDALDRPIAMGIVTDLTNGTNRTYHANLAATSTSYPNPASFSSNELLTQTHYDDYTGMNSTTTSTLPGTIAGTTAGTGNSAFSTDANTAPLYAQPLTQSSRTRGQPTWMRTEAIGGSYTPNSKYLYAVNFYDNNGDLIQVQSINLTGGKDINTIQYNFTNKPIINVQTQVTVGTSNTQTNTAVAIIAYDNQERLQTITRSLSTTYTNGSAAVSTPAVIVLSNSYDELGQLKQKNLGQQRDANNNLISTPMETLAYDYNVRGWLLGINRAYLSPGYTIPAGGGNFFGLELAYDQTISVTGHSFTTGQYTGSLTGISWKSKGDAIDRQYNFTYDNASRMTAANFIQNSSGSSWDNSYLDFTVSGLTYDYNSNIQSMNRKGFQVGGSVMIDQLTYTYVTNSNRLQNVVDAVNSPTTRLGDFRSSQTYITALGGSKTVANAPSYTDYTYDANGNMTKDLNKDIGSSSVQGVLYNYLNLPSQVNVTNKGNIQYVYDATGSKLQKITTENNASVNYNGTAYTTNITTTTTYIGGFVYKSLAYSNASLSTLQYNFVLQFQAHREGRIRFLPVAGSIAASYVFDYFITDNLNSVRMVLTDEKQTDNYPAATLEMATYNGATAESVESLYYTINSADVVSTTSPTVVPWVAAIGSAATYPNYNNGISTSNPNPNSNPTVNSAYVYRLNPSVNPGDNTGLGITIKVMAGDQVSIYAKSAWHNPTAGSINNSYSLVNSTLTNFLSAFAGTSAVVNGTHGAVTGSTLNNSATTTPLGTILTSNNTNTSTGGSQPVKAGINWILFDDQFRPVQSGSGYDAVSTTADNVKTHVITGLPTLTMQKNGYLYVYCSNESNMDVVFDNLQVVNNRGPILEETHLYPDGLTMAGISDRAWNKAANSYHYQGKEMQNMEFSDGSGLEAYDFNARYYDPQLGVWHNQDPDAQYASPYVGMANRWPNGVDPTGKSWLGNILKAPWNALKIVAGLFAWNSHESFWGNLKDIFSRFTWQLPQEVVGLVSSELQTVIGLVNKVSYFDGATVLNTSYLKKESDPGGGTAFTIGSFISGPSDMRASPDDPVFRHEYGRYLQSQADGPTYLTFTAIPDLFSPGNDGPTAQDGNARALAYFTKYYNGQFTWDYTNYPVFLGERRPGFVDFLPFIIGGPGGEIGFATGDFLYRLIAGLF